MQRLSYAVKVTARQGAGQDRAAVFERDDGSLVIALADGAGGTSHGASAAQAVVDTVARHAPTASDWSAILSDLDRDAARLQGGQTTAIVLVVDIAIRGASVGDSEAWLILPNLRVESLTQHQHRKPLLGAGARVEATSGATLVDCTLVVASDGLFRYAKAADIARVASGADLTAAADALVELVRSPTGGLPDDVSVVLVRRPR